MPTYIYKYVDDQGETNYIEKQFKMSERPDSIMVEDGDACYRATNVIGRTARMSLNWKVKGTSSDLPPENAV